MAQTVLITLTTAGADTGPFNLYSNIDGYTVPFEMNVPKLSLEAGFVSFLVPDAASIIRVQSMDALCTNYVDITLMVTTTTSTSTSSTSTTSTTSTTTTAPPSDLELIGNIVFNNLGVTTDYSVTFAGSYIINLSAPAGSNDYETDTMPYSASVFVIVDKTSNGGIAQEDVLIQWFKEGVLQHSDTVLTGNLVNSVYTIVGVNPTDELRVEITEAT